MRHTSTCLILVALAATHGTVRPAQAFAPAPAARAYEIDLPRYPLDFAPTHAAASRASDIVRRELGGRWSVHRWSRAARTPAWVYGTGSRLGIEHDSSDPDIESAVRAFVAAHAEIFHARDSDLSLEMIARGLGKIGVHFEQRFHGLRIIGGRVSVILTDAGDIVAFGSEFHEAIPASPIPSLTWGEAEVIAKSSLQGLVGVESADVRPELVVVPVELAGGGAEYRLAWRVRVATQDPYGVWRSYVDAHAGTVFWRENEVQYAYSGNSIGAVDIPGYCEAPSQATPLRNMSITLSGFGTAETDSMGAFVFSAPDTGPRTVTARFDGHVLNVDRQDGVADAVLSTPLQPGVPVTLQWTDANSHPAERDAFHWVNATDAYVRSLDPTWTYDKYSVYVNVSASCGATWSGTTMSFFWAAGGCVNTARIGSIVAHEFGHGVQSSLIGSQGNEGLGEGNADIMATLMTDESVIGRGIYVDQCSVGLRDCQNDLRYPEDVVDQGNHAAGRVIAGFHWDVWQGLAGRLGPGAGKVKAAQLWHYARKVFRPTYQPDQVLAYFLMDDDDGNLANGTPDYGEVCAAAQRHGFACPDRAALVSAPTSVAGEESALVTFTVTASEPDGNPIASLSASPLPTGATFTPNGTNTSGVFAWVPRARDGRVEPYSVTFTALSGSPLLPGSATASIHVANNVCHEPFLFAPSFMLPKKGEKVEMNIQASDSDSARVSWIVDRSGLPGGNDARFDSSGFGNWQGHFTWTPTAQDWGEFNVTFTALSGPSPECAASRTTRIHVIGSITGAVESVSAPWRLSQNRPNPFNPETVIEYSIAREGTARLAVYDLQGRLVLELLNAVVGAGNHSIRWRGQDSSGRPLPSGVYSYRLQAPGLTQTRRMVLLR